MTAPRKRLILAACILGTTVVTIDSSAINVALPAIAGDLGGGLAGQQWTSNAYLVTLGSLLLIGGSLGDIFGERRVFAFGIVAFGLTSIVCAVAPTIEILVAGRALQGVAGALLTPAALAVIVATFPQAERGKAVGTWTAWGGIGVVFGPILGGPARGRGLVALDLRDQRAARDLHLAADHAGGAPGPRAGPRRPGGRDRGRALRARPRWNQLRADRAAAPGLDRSRGVPRARRSAR